jgi:hypothetical protein
MQSRTEEGRSLHRANLGGVSTFFFRHLPAVVHLRRQLGNEMQSTGCKTSSNDTDDAKQRELLNILDCNHINRLLLPKRWIITPRKRPSARSDWRIQRAFQGLRVREGCAPATLPPRICPHTQHPPLRTPSETASSPPTPSRKRTPKPSKSITHISVFGAPERASSLTPISTVLRRVFVANRRCARPRGHLAPEGGVAWQTFCRRSSRAHD